MKKNFILAFLVATAFAALPAFAEDKNILIVFAFHPGGASGLEGNFHANGILSESGTADSTVAIDAGVVTANKTMHFAGGDVYMTVQGPLNTANSPATITGQWKLTGGTGAYTGIRGSGDCVVLVLGPGTFSGAYQGRVNLLKDDKAEGR